MNIQALMKQAQKMQKDVMEAKKQIDNKVFEIEKSFVTIKAKGNKKIESIKINVDSIDKDEVEVLEDLILLAINELNDKIDKETEEKLGKYTSGMPGLF